MHLQSCKAGLVKLGDQWCTEFDLELLVMTYRFGHPGRATSQMIEAALANPDGYLYNYLVISFILKPANCCNDA